MTIIQSGQSIPLSLSAGQSLVVKDMSGTSSVAGSVTREDAQSRIGQGFFVYGPVASAASVTLTTTGVTDYQIVNGDPTPANQQLLYDPGNPPTSGPTLSGASAGAVRAPIQALSSCTIMGDSLYAFGNPGGGAGGAGLNGMFSNSSLLWANDILAASGQSLDVVAFRAVGGKTVLQVINEQLPSALTDATEIASLHVGANSLNPSIGNVTLDVYASQMETLIAALAAAKKLVLVEAVYPVNQAGNNGLQARAYTIPSANAIVEAICRRYANVIYVDTYAALLDPSSSTLDAKAGYLNATDGIHFLTLGAQQAGYALARKILQVAKITPYRSFGANLLPALSGTGGSVTPNAGSITGTPPPGWNVTVSTGSAAVTITQRQPDIIRLAITNAGATASTVILQVADINALGAAVGSGVAPLKGSIGFQVSGVTNAIRAAYIALRQNASSNNFSWIAGSKDTTNEPTPVLPTTAFGGVRTTTPMPINTATNQMEFIVGAEVGANTGAVVLDVYAPSLIKFAAS